MKAYAQPLTGVIRVGPDTDEYGKPWDYAVTYVSDDNETCTLMALKGDGGVTTAHWRAVLAAVRRLGFKRVRWERKKPAGAREVAAEVV